MSEHLEGHAQDGSQKKGLTHRITILGWRRRVHLIVAMQVVHALGAGQLHHLLRKYEDLGDFLVALDGAEGLKEVFVAAE